MRTAKIMIRLGGCPGQSESSLGAQSFRWFCHEAAHLLKFSHLGVRQTAIVINVKTLAGNLNNPKRGFFGNTENTF